MRIKLTLLSLVHTIAPRGLVCGRAPLISDRWTMPMTSCCPRARSRSGFTLIEILIIAALIAILSGIAVISIQFLVVDAKRKAALGDLKTIAHGITIAQYDQSFFPRIGYMCYPAEELAGFAKSPLTGGAATLPPDFQYSGINFDPIAPQVYAKWKGPYFPKSTGRSIISTGGVGYVVKMRMPSTNGNDAIILDWPADPFGNPYVMYLVHVARNAGSTTNAYQLATPGLEPNAVAVVVSYGSNQVPGGSSDANKVAPFREQAEGFRFYDEDTSGSGARYVALTLAQQVDRFPALGGEMRPSSGIYSNPDEFPGILDTGSDDLIVPIP